MPRRRLRTQGGSRGSLHLYRYRIDHIGFNETGVVFAECRQVCFSDTSGGFLVHLFDRPAKPRPAHDGPPIVRRSEGLSPILGDDFRLFDATLSQKLTDGLRRNDAFPRIEGIIEIGTELFYSRPPCGRPRLEHARSPSGDGELAPGVVPFATAPAPA